MNKLLATMVLLCVSLNGCGVSSSDIINACAEIGATSQGYDGPSKRMDILKSYGITPNQASEIEGLLRQRFEMEKIKNPKEACGVAELYPFLACEVIIKDVLDNTNIIFTAALEITKNCREK